MRFDYRFTPEIRITLRNKKSTLDVYALVDSGADFCTFPTFMGTKIGLDIKSVPVSKMKGLGGEVDTWYRDIEIIVRGNMLKVKAAFVDNLPKAILGRSGFFEEYKVIFSHSEKYVEIKPMNN